MEQADTAGPQEFDYIIVGAGTAGCVLARRLSELGDLRILLIEAGGRPRDWRLSMPLAWPTLLGRQGSLWRYPDPSGRIAPLIGGRVAGGSSSVNALAYVRGNRADYDRWARSGLTSFSYEAVLPYFRRLECWEHGSDIYRGAEGPIPVIQSRLRDPALTALMQAAESQGAPTYIDYNGANQAGFGLTQLTIDNGRRASAASCYLAPALASGNVQLATGALATRIMLERGRAVGVQFRQGAREKTARAAREVIIAAGAIQSPHLLNLSGIGEPSALGEHSITVAMDLPGVGRNLRNHVSIGLSYRRRNPGTIQQGLRLDRLARASAQWLVNGDGFLAIPPNAAMGFVETRRSLGGVPDIQVLFLATLPQAQPYCPLIEHPYTDGFVLSAVLLRPESTGQVRLRSADPNAQPLVAQNVMTTSDDRAVLIDGLRRVDQLAHEPAIEKISAGPCGRHPADFSTTTLDEFIGASAMPMFHPSGTCRMGLAGDDMAVVDPAFRVYGVERLRVVDASVMPDLIGGNPFACVTMLAEKASDMLRGGD